MAQAIDREDIRKAIGRITGWLVASGDTTAQGNSGATTLVAAASGLNAGLYSSARDQHIRTRSVVAITESGNNNRGERRYATGSPDSSGIVTVSPKFTNQTADTAAYEIWDSDGPHPDDLDRCIDLALARLCWYWRLTPVTWLRGGDVGDELVVAADDLREFSSGGTVLWTGDGNITLTLQDLDMPDEFTRRVIRLVATAADGAIESAVIECDPTDRDTWRIVALARSMATASGAAAGSGNGTEIKLIDKTNTAEITPDDALSTVNRGWTLLESNFKIPATCYQLAVQLNVETSGEVGEFAWIQLWPPDATVIAMPRRIATKKHVGALFTRRGDVYSRFSRQPWSGSLQRRDVGGRGVSLELSPALGDKPLWYYEKVGYPALSSATVAATDDDNTIWADQAWIEIAALVECYRFLEVRDRKEYPGRWDEDLHDAEVKLASAQVDYGIEPMAVEDAVRPRRRAFVKV